MFLDAWETWTVKLNVFFNNHKFQIKNYGKWPSLFKTFHFAEPDIKHVPCGIVVAITTVFIHSFLVKRAGLS